MEDELVLLTSYFNLANGRRQDTADTFRVDPSLPSGTSPDGTAALYIVTEGSTGGHMGPRARRMAADTIAWEYSTHSDEAPSRRLKGALRAAHEEILREFDGHVTVGASVIAVERDDIFLAQVAPGQVYVVHDESLHSISASIGGSSPYSRGLGSTEGPETSLFRDAIAPGDVIALSSSWFHRAADPEELRECFAAGTADDIAEAMLELARQHDVHDATAIVIEAELASQLDRHAGEAAPRLMEQVDEAVQALANVGRMLVNELRPEGSEEGGGVREPAVVGAGARRGLGEASTSSSLGNLPSVGELGPAVTEPGPEEPSGAGLDEFEPASPAVREQATEEIEALGAAESPIPSDEGSAPSALDSVEEESGRQRSELEQVNTRLQYELDMGDVIPPVQAFPDTSTEPSRIYATSKDIQAVNRRPRRFGGVGHPTGDSGAPVLRPALADMDLRPAASRGAPAPAVWLSVAGVAVVAILALVIYLHNRQGTTRPAYLSLVKQDLALASSAKSPAAQDVYLAKAQRNINHATQVGEPAASISLWRTRLLNTTDTLHHITLANTPTLLATFTAPTEIATSPDTLYVIDTSKNGAYSISSNPASSPTEIVAGGETDSNLPVGKISHITTNGSTALVLDDKNVLVRDTNGAKTAATLYKVVPTQATKQMANYGPDVYLLDPGGNQIWRYADAVSANVPQPSGFFAPGGPNIRKAVSFTLDDKDLYVLESNGTVLKFDNQANAQPFPLKTRSPLVSPSAIFTDVGLPYVWIADPAGRQIVQVDKSGKYVRAYVSGNAKMDFSQIKGIAVPPSDKWIYVLTGTKVFRLAVVP